MLCFLRQCKDTTSAMGHLALSGTFMHLCVLFGAFVTFLSWIAEVIEDHAYLASGEILTAAVIAG